MDIHGSGLIKVQRSVEKVRTLRNKFTCVPKKKRREEKELGKYYFLLMIQRKGEIPIWKCQIIIDSNKAEC